MANRSMLFATDALPGASDAAGPPRTVGLSEWPYAIPLVYRLLVSAEPRVCASLIWNRGDRDADEIETASDNAPVTADPLPIGIVGDYDGGVARLAAFFDHLTAADPAARPFAEEALTFLQDPRNRRRWLVLEAGEIFAMLDTDLAQQARDLVRELADLEPEIEANMYRHDEIERKLAKPTFWDRLFGNAKPERQAVVRRDSLRELGLGAWTNVLFYDLSEEADGSGS